MSVSKDDSKVPFLVDLDGTFLIRDTFAQDLGLLFRRQPLVFLRVLWLYCSRRRAKAKQLAAIITASYTTHYQPNPFFKQFLSSCSRHQHICLITGANRIHARRVAVQYPLFNQIIASDQRQIMSVKNKIIWLKLQQVKEFDYAGDRFADRHIFYKARKSYLVRPSFCLLVWSMLYSKNIYYYDLSAIYKILFTILKKRYEN